MPGQIIEIDIFLERSHKTAKIAYFSNLSQTDMLAKQGVQRLPAKV